MALGVAVAVCFVTGLISHFIQHPQPWFWWPTQPVWLYRFTQGLHVASGIAAIPLLIVKLWSVWPKLFERPILGGVVRQLERASILVLVASMLFQLSTGLMNIAQWYAFQFFFTTVHYAMSYVAVGAVLVHIGVKLPVIRRALSDPLEDVAQVRGWPWGWRHWSPRGRRCRYYDACRCLPRAQAKGPKGFRSTGRRSRPVW